MGFPETFQKQKSAIVEIKFTNFAEKVADWIKIPNDHLVSFSYSFGGGGNSQGKLTLYDSYNQGRGISFLDTFIATLTQTARFALTIRWGWQGNMTPPVRVFVSNMSYKLTDGGLNITLSMLPLGFGDKAMQATSDTNFGDKKITSLLSKEPEYKKIKIKELLIRLVDWYNKELNDETKLNFYKINSRGEKSIGENCINCVDDIFDANPYENGFEASGKTFSECMNDILEYINKKNESELKNDLTRYHWGVFVENDKRNLYIWKTDLSTKKVPKRKYYYRRGEKSNIISFDYKEFPFLIFFNQAVEQNIETYIIGKNGETVETVSRREKTEKDMTAKEKRLRRKANLERWGKNYNLGDSKGNINPLYPSNKISANMVNSNWGETFGGRILLRNIYRELAYNARPNVTLSLLGDPAYLPPFKKETLIKTLNVTKESKTDFSKITTGDTVLLFVNDPAGKPTFFSGDYMVFNFSHEIKGAGDYKTIVQMIKMGKS